MINEYRHYSRHSIEGVSCEDASFRVASQYAVYSEKRQE